MIESNKCVTVKKKENSKKEIHFIQSNISSVFTTKHNVTFKTTCFTAFIFRLGIKGELILSDDLMYNDIYLINKIYSPK